jgi:hypothetical protein
MYRHNILRFSRYVAPFALALVSFAPAHAMASKVLTKTWSVEHDGAHLDIGYGSGENHPQYAVLDTASSYFRMVYSTAANWATSTILLPSLWSASSCPTQYCQGAPVKASWHDVGADLRLTLHGTIAKLKVTVLVTIQPPAKNVIVAHVSTTVAGQITLDNRPGEAFKPVMLSSMHDSATVWDARAAFAGKKIYSLPSNGWIIQPPVQTRTFGLIGGTSTWKVNAPTVIVGLGRTLAVTGWVTQDSDPNDDNVGFWCASTKVLPSWKYTLTYEAANLGPQPSS